MGQNSDNYPGFPAKRSPTPTFLPLEVYETYCTVKLGFKELLNKEQIGNSEPFPVTNLPVYLINSKQIGISEQFCDGQKVP